MGAKRHTGEGGDIWWLVDTSIRARLQRLLTRIFEDQCKAASRKTFVHAYLNGVVSRTEIAGWESSAIDFVQQLTAIVVERFDTPLDDGRHVVTSLLCGCRAVHLHEHANVRMDFGFLESLFGAPEADRDPLLPSLPPFFPRPVNALVLARSTIDDWGRIERDFSRRIAGVHARAEEPGLADFAAAVIDHTHAEHPLAVQLFDTLAHRIERPAKEKLLGLEDEVCEHFGIECRAQRNRSDPPRSCASMGFAALYPSYEETRRCRMGRGTKPIDPNRIRQGV